MDDFCRLRLWALLGLVISLYALHVELNLEDDKDYEAMCDISPRVSCTAAFRSVYGRGFGLGYLFSEDEFSEYMPPNGLVGVCFYILLLITSLSNDQLIKNWQMRICILANFSTVYLAYLLYFVLDDLCLVCTAIYFVNSMLLTITWRIAKGG